MRCVFRTDGSLEIGSGHLVRCCNLAKSLQKSGFDILFLTQKLSGDFYKIINQHGFDLKILNSNKHESNSLDWQIDAEYTKQIISKDDILILDHYGLDSKWESLILENIQCLAVIDDLANRKHNCHILIDANFYLEKNRYQNLITSDAITLLGTEYTILSENYQPFKRPSDSFDKKVSQILLFFGGNDHYNLSQKTIQYIEKIWPNKFIFTCVLGKNSIHNNSLIKLQKFFEDRITLHIQTDRMPELMEKADIYIGSGGTVTWERAIKSLPSLVIAVAENQVQSAIDLDKINAISYVGNYSELTDEIWPILATKLNELTGNRSKRLELSTNSFKLVDGHGNDRIVLAINNFLKLKYSE